MAGHALRVSKWPHPLQTETWDPPYTWISQRGQPRKTNACVSHLPKRTEPKTLTFGHPNKN